MVVRGSTTIIFADRLLARWTLGAKLMLLPLAGIVVAMTFDEFRELPPEPFGSAIGIAAGLIMILMIWAFWFALVVAAVAIAHFRTSKDQRRISYELDDAAVVMRDATGASLACPWGNVRGARETARAVRLTLKPMGSRYIPKRAFAAIDLPMLRALLQERLGRNARLKGG